MYRELMEYPPAGHMLAVMIESRDERTADEYALALAEAIKNVIIKGLYAHKARIIGPTDASVKKINDVYRKLIYLKSKDQDILVALKDAAEEYKDGNRDRHVRITFDMDPVNGY